MDPAATVYSDEASMVNGSNGESTLPVVTPQSVEGPEMGLVPQTQAQPVAGLFGDQRIFVNAPQYHWHVQGTVGADDEARHHIVALAERLHQFGHRTEEREIEIWHRLSIAADIPGVESRLTGIQEIWEAEYNKFTEELSNYVNKEINDFRRSIVVTSDNLSQLRQNHTSYREDAQALSQRMDSVQNRVTFIRSAMTEQVDRTLQQVKDDLRTEFQTALENRAVSLETYIQSRVNEVRQETYSTLEILKETVAAVRESQEKMWRAMDGMSNEIQELVQREAGTEQESDTEPTPVDAEPAIGGPIPAETSTIVQPSAGETGQARSFFSFIPKEDVVSVKDSVTSGLPAHELLEGTEAGGMSGHPATPEFKLVRDHAVKEGSADDVGKTALVPPKEEKGELLMDSMVTSGWKSTEYSTPVGESVSLVGKTTGMPETTSGGSVPHTAGVGQMKLEAPPRYSGKRQPGVRVWLTQMERYMRLMRYAPTDWLDVVAMRVEGAASSWVNAVLQEISEGRRPIFRTWAQFRDAMVQRFEPVTEVEEARKQLRALKQTGRVAGYVQKFQELQYRLPGMTDEEAFHAFLSGLQPHLQEHVGAHVQGNLEAAIAMAQRLEVYRGGDGAKTTNKGSKKFKNQKKGNVTHVEGGSSGGTVQVVQVVKKQQQKKGKGGSGSGGKKTRRGGRKRVQCHNCGGDHFLRDCKEWKEIKEKLRSSSGKD